MSKNPDEMFDVKKYEQEIESIKSSIPNANEKIKWLSEKWSKTRYSGNEEASLMGSALGRSKPIYTAIVVDNLDYFKQHDKECEDYFETCLTIACLSGSKRVAEYLLQEKLKWNYKEHPELLAYIAASANQEWTKEVAYILASEKITMPLSIHRLASDPVIDQVKSCYNKIKMGKNTPLGTDSHSPIKHSSTEKSSDHPSKEADGHDSAPPSGKKFY